MAIHKQNKELVDKFIALGADINIRDKTKQGCLLHLCAERGL